MNIETQLNNPLITGTELISLELDGLPPTVNLMYRNVGTRRYKTAACHDYQDFLASRLASLWNGKPPVTSPVSLYVKFSQCDRRRWDIDNRAKALQDCFQMSGIIKDDRQIDLLILHRVHNADKASTLLSLWTLSD